MLGIWMEVGQQMALSSVLGFAILFTAVAITT